MSKTHTTSEPDADPEPVGASAYHSEYVPTFLSDAEREAFKQEMLDELELVTKLGHLRPAAAGPEPDQGSGSTTTV